MDANWVENLHMNFNAENKMNNEIFLKPKIKDELMDDSSMLPADYVDDTIDDDSEISCEDSKIDVGDTKIGLDIIKWKKSLTFDSTNEINERMTFKSEIKNEPIDDHEVDTSSNDDGGKINCDDTKADIFPPVQVTENADKSEEENKNTSVNNENDHKPPEKKYHCDICDKGFNQKMNLFAHTCIHNSEKPYKCGVCGKRFRRMGNFYTHEVMHTGGKPYQCDICKKCFSTSSDLKRHNRAHSGEKPCRCKVCKKFFSKSSDLKRHYHVHTRERLYHCDICGKSFVRVNYFNTHKLMHTGETPELDVHNREHTGEKPYKCEVCEKSFADSSQLTRHNSVHTREKRYQGRL